MVIPSLSYGLLLDIAGPTGTLSMFVNQIKSNQMLQIRPFISRDLSIYHMSYFCSAIELKGHHVGCLIQPPVVVN